jgi:hypothetical protein
MKVELDKYARLNYEPNGSHRCFNKVWDPPSLTTVSGLENQLTWTIITSASYKRVYILASTP